jgi:uncharacterized protein (TIRG00374 family)
VLALLALFLHNVDLRGVAGEVMRAQPGWLVLALVTMPINLALRAWRWQYLLAPLGGATFGNVFRATAIGFAASSVLPARAGELIRPFVLARRAHLSATGAFATVVLERVLDTLTVLLLLTIYIWTSGRGLGLSNPVALAAMTWAGAAAAVGVVAALVACFVLSGDPAGVGRALDRLSRVLPSKLAALLAGVAERFVTGLGAVRRPGRVIVALVLSFPLWISICLGPWAVAQAFQLAVPFTGSFLLVAMLVIGVAVPTPGAVGGFHEAFRIGVTTFFGAANQAAVGAAIVLHAISVVPYLVIGLMFAAQEGINFSKMRQLAAESQPGHTV